jgi:hypothetical protein
MSPHKEILQVNAASVSAIVEDDETAILAIVGDQPITVHLRPEALARLAKQITEALARRKKNASP